MGDRRLLASIEDAMSEAARLSGDWLVCRPGCTQCCLGPFPITQLDVLRLRDGLAALAHSDPTRAAHVRARAAGYIAAIPADYPGDRATGLLDDADGLPSSMDDLACPALDPSTGLCDLYTARPVTCRTFGPVTELGDGTFGACELCYNGASDDDMARCAVEPDPTRLEDGLLTALAEAGLIGTTIVAYALSASWT